MRSGGSATHDGISVLIRRDTRELAVSLAVRTQQKGGYLSVSQGGASPEPNYAGSLILDL